MLEDHYSIDTPEGLRLDLTLAGAGTRIVAAIIDTLMIGAVLFIVFSGTLFVAPLFIGGDAGFAFFALVIAFATAVPVAYYVIFETMDGGRSIGKRAMRLRVVRMNGLPVGFSASLIRNLLRIIDLLPAAYLVGFLSLLASPANQRVGDLAAGTLVIREPAVTPVSSLLSGTAGDGPRWDVSAITDQQLEAIGYFLERRSTLTNEQQLQFARKIATPLRPLVGTAGEHRTDTEFLEKVWTSKTDSG